MLEGTRTGASPKIERPSPILSFVMLKSVRSRVKRTAMSLVREWMVLVALLSGSATAIAQSWEDEKGQEALLASSWAGEILGIPFNAYLLDEGLIVMVAGDQDPRSGRWFFHEGKFTTSVRLSEKINVGLRAEVRGDAMIGASNNMAGQVLPFELRRQASPDPRLLAAAPPGRPYPAPPPATAADFEGTYEASLPEKVGQSPPFTKVTLTCKLGICVFAMGNDVIETFDRLDPIRRGHFRQAKFALNYAREHKENARGEVPHISLLLASDADIQSCINLGYKTPRFSGADIPGLIILCKIDRNPWDKPAVLYMGSILANCGKAFCRYMIVPMLRRE